MMDPAPISRAVMERAVTYLTVALTVAMIMLGAVVHGTGSSLACPDWPMCYGSAFPTMVGGVLFEHSHRLLGTLIGVCIVTLNILVLKRHARDFSRLALASAIGLIVLHAVTVGVGVSKMIWPLAVGGLVLNIPLFIMAVMGARKQDATPVWTLTLLHLTIIQGILGGLTVMLKLPIMVSSAHLGLSMIVLSTLVVLALHLRDSGQERAPLQVSRKPLTVAIALLYAQILLGALVKHTGASLACGVDVINCNGGAPHGGPAHLHFTHRILAVLVLAAIIVATIPIIRAAKRQGNQRVRFFASAAHVIVILQIALGISTVLSYIAVPFAAAHLGLGALLLADLVALFVNVKPSPVLATAAEPARGGLAHAT
jgi:heme A synthase